MYETRYVELSRALDARIFSSQGDLRETGAAGYVASVVDLGESHHHAPHAHRISFWLTTRITCTAAATPARDMLCQELLVHSENCECLRVFICR